MKTSNNKVLICVYQLNILLINVYCDSSYESIVHTIPLYGGEQEQYYYTDIYVGTPPQKQSVIVDTGSDFQAFPCTHCDGNSCGRHNNPRFDINASSTLEKIKSGTHYKNFICNKDSEEWIDKNNHSKGKFCGFSKYYAEGSGLEGSVYSDYIEVVAPSKLQISNGPHKINPSLMRKTTEDTHPRAKGLFGCTYKESGLFKTQKVNGILGLFHNSNSPSNEPNFLDEYFDAHQDKSRAFSQCLASEGGFMTLGGFNNNKHLPGEKPVVVPYKDNYHLSISDIELFYKKDGQNNYKESIMKGQKYKNKPIPAMLDSGTTLSYVDPEIFNQFNQLMKKFCKEEGHCGNQHKSVKNYDFCVGTNETYKTKSDLATTFPKLFVKFANGKSLIWFPEDYQQQDYVNEEPINIFCLGIKPNFVPGPNVLGGSFMRHYDIYFNRPEGTVSLIRSNCDEIVEVRGLQDWFIYARKLAMSYIGEAGIDFTNCVYVLALMVIIYIAWLKKSIFMEKIGSSYSYFSKNRAAEIDQKFVEKYSTDNDWYEMSKNEYGKEI